MEIWTTIILPIISGLVACAPLAIKLVEYVKAASKEKNWKAVVQLVLSLMKEAEKNYTNGAEKKEYVISSIKAMENTLQYDIDEKAIGELIDSIILATKQINTK